LKTVIFYSHNDLSSAAIQSAKDSETEYSCDMYSSIHRHG